MKKGNLITASICCGVGLALIGTGIYYLTTGSRLTGGVIIGLGLAICAMFVVTLVMMRKFDRLKADADAKYEEERARQYAAVKEMVERLRAAEGPKEVIFALSGSVEGETTAFYIYRQIEGLGVRVSTLARGLSFGADLEYADSLTLGRSIIDRQAFKP